MFSSTFKLSTFLEAMRLWLSMRMFPSSTLLLAPLMGR